MNGKEGSGLSDGNYVVVSYDLDTTGRRLIDEIVQIGANCLKQGKDGESENCSYSQYVMPHRNPKPAAKRAYGFAVVNIGRSRMLKDIHSGQILKTKSEITALQSFLVWLEEAKGDSDGIILVSHEQNPKILVPLLIQSLARYNLVPAFSKIVKGFCNSANVIDKIGNKNEITSLSLRSLCKTVLQNTSLPTTTAIDRCQRVLEVLCSVAEKAEDKENKSKVNLSEVVRPFATTIVAEEDNLKNLEHIESIQLTLRPIFGELLGGSWQLRERMVRVRRALAEKHLDYNKLKEVVKLNELKTKVETLELQDQDKDELITIISNHFTDAEKTKIKEESKAAIKPET